MKDKPQVSKECQKLRLQSLMSVKSTSVPRVLGFILSLGIRIFRFGTGMVERVFNGGEAFLWLAYAVIVAVRFHRAPQRLRRTARAMAMIFIVFAVSDVIEMRTGAWWRPLGLLLLKAACLAGLLW